MAGTVNGVAYFDLIKMRPGTLYFTLAASKIGTTNTYDMHAGGTFAIQQKPALACWRQMHIYCDPSKLPLPRKFISSSFAEVFMLSAHIVVVFF
eukprot:scaffold15595_cov108-Cylindrotheca_fusiformis.AAC.1